MMHLSHYSFETFVCIHNSPVVRNVCGRTGPMAARAFAWFLDPRDVVKWDRKGNVVSASSQFLFYLLHNFINFKISMFPASTFVESRYASLSIFQSCDVFFFEDISPLRLLLSPIECGICIETWHRAHPRQRETRWSTSSTLVLLRTSVMSSSLRLIGMTSLANLRT